MRRLLLATVAVLALAAPAAAQDPQITAADVAPHLQALQGVASANGGNRAAGLPGANATADYIVTQLEQAGWQVQRQAVTFPYFDLRSPPRVHTLRPGRDVVAVRYSGAGDVTGRLRLVESEGCGRESFRAVRRGDVVLAPFAACTFSRLAATIKREGGAALLTIASEQSFPLTSVSFVPGLPIPVLGLSDPAARRLYASRRNRPVRVTVDATIAPRTADNVVAELPGTDGRSVFMAGGHLDSVIEGPGINDNASGVAALLEMGEKLAAAPRGRSTLRLGFWTAEEHGLFGSRHYVKTLDAAERKRTAGYLNLDMVGSPNAVPEIYSSRNKLSSALRKRIRGAGSTPFRRADSDHDAFRRAGIAVSGIYTGGLESKTREQRRRFGGRAGALRDRCYHRACDTADSASATVTARMATAAAGAMAEVAR